MTAQSLGVTVAELRTWDIATIYEAEGFAQGLATAKWAHQNPAKGQG